MWLPETAVDAETLDVLAAEGIRFTILAPHQVKEAPPKGIPGRYTTSSGKEIALCVYDGDLSHGVAFGPLTRDARAWTEAILAKAPGVVSVATDGETYGHHHRFGEMALAATVLRLSAMPNAHVENFASYLAKHPLEHAVELVEPTSWSCAHGVERWRSNCGCRIHGAEFPDQSWRTPLREGLATLADGLHEIFDREGRAYWPDPWAARDAYAGGEDRGEGAMLTMRARQLLEMERGALRMFTSCAWFFDDIGGIEPLQVLGYARRAVELAGPDAQSLEAKFIETLALARSNDAAVGTGKDVYLGRAVPAVPPLARVAAGAAAVNAVAPETFYTPPLSSEVRVEGDVVHVVQRRTGEDDRFVARVDVPTPHDIDVSVRSLGNGHDLHLHTADLPERDRFVVAKTLRRGLAEELLSADALDRVATGDATLSDSARIALTHAVAELEHQLDDDRVARVLGLIDLVELLGATIPFDAQTSFYRLRESLGQTDGERVAAIGVRLGFTRP
jgi:hypothetical protein